MKSDNAKKKGLLAALVAIAVLGVPATALGEDTVFTLGGRVVSGVVGAQAHTEAAEAEEAIWQETTITLFALPGVSIVAETAPDGEGEFAFDALGPGEYLIQVVAPNHVVSKTTVAVGAGSEITTQQLEINLVRPIDPGMGHLTSGPAATAGVRSAGVNHAFGCVSISAVFVQFQGSDAWTQTEINTAMNAAQTGLTAFQSIAPPAAHVTTHVENFGTFTVTNAVGNTCPDSEAWVDEVLQQAGYTTGSLSDRVNALSDDRRDANCGTDPTCAACGANSSSYLFFVTRDDSALWGGWNCSNLYLISYWNRYSDAQVYIHEVGHGFGANDEYCVPNQGYCCGWVTGAWGCTNTGGCLNATNDNCDPPCGTDCDAGAPFVDCQDGCPNANCTSHTACAMDGGASLAFCQPTRRQIGWVDSDGDQALDCLESACGTDPNDASSIPGCLPNLAPEADANGPYSAECQGLVTTVQLDGAASSDPNPGDVLSFAWTTTCPGGSFDAPDSATPVLTVDTSTACDLFCDVTLTVTDSAGDSDTDRSDVRIEDTTAPQITCAANVTIECDEPTHPTHTGEATATDVCDPSPTVTWSDDITPGACPEEYTIARTWVATDRCSHTDDCMQIIEVVDTTPPVISCNAPSTIRPPDAPISFTATGTDNCDSDPASEITSYNCYKYTKKGRYVSKLESCIVTVDGTTITIFDSGGVGDHIEWTVDAVDSCGNPQQVVCEVEVVNPSL